MPVWDLRAEVSDHRHAQVNELRGDVELNEFLAFALDLGLGHIEEERILRQRDRSYEAIRDQTGNFAATIKKHKLTVVTSPKPAANTSGFGNDMTTRRGAG